MKWESIVLETVTSSRVIKFNVNRKMSTDNKIITQNILILNSQSYKIRQNSYWKARSYLFGKINKIVLERKRQKHGISTADKLVTDTKYLTLQNAAKFLLKNRKLPHRNINDRA